MPTSSGNKTHDANVLAAEVSRQNAIAPSSSRATVRSADLAYHRAVVASAKANGISPGQAITALFELGAGGV
jgi:hypothetical protein